MHNKNGNNADICRRKFLMSGAAGIAAGGANKLISIENRFSNSQNNPGIKTVTLGKTGWKVANIGYGTSRGSLDPSVINYAIRKGINYFDCSEGYGGGQAERNLGRAIKKVRDKVYITTKVGSVNAAGRLLGTTTKQEILERIRAGMERLDTPYLDAIFIHGAGDPDFGGFDNPNLHDAVKQLKDEGKVKYFGFSCHHNNLVEIIKHCVESKKIDLMLVAYNYFQQNLPQGREAPTSWLKDLNEAIKLAHSKDIGVTTMKILQGAQGANAIKSGISRTEAKQAAAKWSLNNPNVDVAVISLSSISEIDEFTAISNKPMDYKDWKTLEALSGSNKNSICRIGCPAPCMDKCPAGVAAPDVLRMNMYFTDYGWEKVAMNDYRILGRLSSAGVCESCSDNSCTANCIYRLPVRDILVDAHRNLTL